MCLKISCYVKTVEMSLQTSNVLQKLLSLTCKGNDADLFPTFVSHISSDNVTLN